MFDLEQMTIAAEALLATEFSNSPIQPPSQPNHTSSSVPSTTNKKSVIEAFVPKSLLIPERFEARTDLPSLDELMQTDASVLRMTAKQHTVVRGVYQLRIQPISSDCNTYGRKL